MSNTAKNLFFWMIAAFVIVIFWNVSWYIQKKEKSLSFNEFIEQVEGENVAQVSVTANSGGTTIVGELKNGEVIRTVAPSRYDKLVDLMIDRDVRVHYRDANNVSWEAALISWLPIILMIVFLIYFMKAAQRSSTGNESFARISARREKRLEIKARCLHHLTVASGGLSEDELRALLGDESDSELDETEVRKALYQMLTDETVAHTEQGIYRLRPYLNPSD